MFEYHDCSNTNVLPMVDIIFARDVVSLLPQNVQDPLIDDFAEKLKGNGIVVLGENESLSARHGWEEKMIDSLFIYSKQ